MLLMPRFAADAAACLRHATFSKTGADDADTSLIYAAEPGAYFAAAYHYF